MGGIKCFTRIKVHKNFCDHLLFYEAVASAWCCRAGGFGYLWCFKVKFLACEDGHFRHGSQFAFGGSDGHGFWQLEGEELGDLLESLLYDELMPYSTDVMWKQPDTAQSRYHGIISCKAWRVKSWFWSSQPSLVNAMSSKAGLIYMTRLKLDRHRSNRRDPVEIAKECRQIFCVEELRILGYWLKHGYCSRVY